MLNTWFPAGSLRQIVAGNTASQLIGRAVSSIATIIMSFLIAQRFGPEGYGDFVKVTTYVGFFYLFADFGLNAAYLQQAVVRKRTHFAESSSWQLLLGLRLTISTMLMVVALFILSLLPRSFGQGYTSLVRFGIVLLLPAIVAQAVTMTTNALFQKMLRYDFSTKAQNIGSAAMLLTAVLLFQFLPVNGSILGVVSVGIGSIITAGIALVLVRKHLRSALPRFHVGEFCSLFRSGVPLGLALIFNLVYFHVDSVVLTLTRSTAEVGIYGLAYKVFELPLVLPIFFMNAVYPLLLRDQKDQGAGEHKIFVRSLQFLFFSSIFIGVVLWICAPLVSLIRPDFVPSVAPMRVLILGLPVYFVSALFMWFIIARKQQRTLLLIHGVAMLSNIIFNVLFVPTYGYMAAAWLTAASEVFVLAASAIVVFGKKPIAAEEGRRLL